MAGKKYDPMTEAAVEVVELDRRKEEITRMEREDKDALMAKCHQMIGQIKAVNMFGKFANVSGLVWLREVKETKIYKDLPGIGSWDSFCNYIGISRQKADIDLQNLATFGEDFLLTVSGLSVGYRELRQLRQLTNAGQIAIEDAEVVIGDERIPFSPDHKDDLQAALEKLLEAKDQIINEKDANVRAQKKISAQKQDLIDLQAKQLAIFEQQAEAKGLSAQEDAFIQQCENARVTIEGYLNKFDPQYNPLPEDATPKMKAVLMHTLSWFRRSIKASYDTAAELYGDPELDSDGWVPPWERNLEESEPDVEE